MGNELFFKQYLDVGDRVVIAINNNLELSIQREESGYVFDAYAPMLVDTVFELGYLFDYDLEEPEED